MAKVSYVDIPPEFRDYYFAGLQSGDRFSYSRVVKKNTLKSVRSKKGFSQKSLMPEASALWTGLSQSEKDNWSLAAVECNTTAWRLFLKDYALRKANGFPGLATPSPIYQALVGQIQIAGSASEIKLVQSHPRNYYIYRKITGTKNSYDPVLITEDFHFPIKIGLSYKSNLVAVEADNFAWFYVRIWYSYQGQNLYYDLIIPLDYQSDWIHVSDSLGSLRSYVVGYDAYIHLQGVRGDLFVDNIELNHSGQNWARDPFCNDINQGFTKNYYQVSKHWAAIVSPVGTIFESIYFNN